jgi:hypothetical protein
MGAATFRFYAELNDFLPVGDRRAPQPSHSGWLAVPS